jgi:hypothetical protein
MLKNAPEYCLMSSQSPFHLSTINDIWGLVLFKSTFEMLIFMNTAFEFQYKSNLSSCLTK